VQHKQAEDNTRFMKESTEGATIIGGGAWRTTPMKGYKTPTQPYSLSLVRVVASPLYLLLHTQLAVGLVCSFKPSTHS